MEAFRGYTSWNPDSIRTPIGTGPISAFEMVYYILFFSIFFYAASFSMFQSILFFVSFLYFRQLDESPVRASFLTLWFFAIVVFAFLNRNR